MKGIKIIMGKELSRVFKDKKLIFSLFILPAVIMVGIFGLMGTLMNSLNSDITEHVSVVYVQNAPEDFKSVMTSSGFESTAEVNYISASDTTEDIKANILGGSVQLLVSFDDNFLDTVKGYEKAGDKIPSVTVSYNSAENYSMEAYSRFNGQVVSAYETKLLGERIGNLELLTVFNLNNDLIVNEEKANGQYLSMMLPYFLTFMLFVGAMSLGVDAVAGEKERGTMASLLLTPVKREQLVLGKFFSLVILSSLSAMVYCAAMLIGLPLMAGGGGMSINIDFTIVEFFQLLVMMLSMVFFYVAMICLLSVFAKSAKEATSYVMPLYMVIMVAGIITMFQSGADRSILQYAIPVYGNAITIQNMLIGEMTVAQFLLSTCSTLVCGIIGAALVTKAFNSEKVMFNA